jgi:hypothetical protein
MSALVDRYMDDLLADIRSPIAAMRDFSLAHADHLQALGPIRVLAFDPCPRCGGRVIASETVATCAAGCDWSHPRRISA